MIRKYKVTISVIFGTLFLIFGFYAPTLSALLLTEKENQFTSINYILIGFGIMFLWGRISNLANVFVETDIIPNRFTCSEVRISLTSGGVDIGRVNET